MKKTLAVFLLVSLVLCLFASCESGGEEVRVFNWGDYMDLDVNDMFEEATGIDVKYSTFIQNEDMYTSVTASEGYYDVICPSDYMISKMAAEGLLAEINFDNIPNFSLIDDHFKDLDFDPDNKYSVPYLWGTVGIIYNTTMVDDVVDSWSILWNEKYAGKMFMMDSVRDSLGVALLSLGYSVNTKDDAELAEAEAALIAQKDLLLAYTEDDLKDKMIAGEGAIGVIYSGDAMVAMEENEDLAYVVPKEGSILWFDNFCILADSPNIEQAEAYINYMCSTEPSLLNFEYILYSSPQKEVIAGYTDEQASDPTLNPPNNILERCEVFSDLGAYTKTYNEIWSRVKG